jgi:SAM-dependent methyltransferase
MISCTIDYKRCSTDLCWIGAKYDTDKSSQRRNTSVQRHCHPYTNFYSSLFKPRRYDPLVIGEFGLAWGASHLMWEEYFPAARVYGFDNIPRFVDDFRTNNPRSRVIVDVLDTTKPDDIHRALENTRESFDILISDSSHKIDDEIVILSCAHRYLKPGGIIITEDIFKSANELEYLEKMKPFLHEYQAYYFVSLDHARRISTGWDNDKMLVCVKAGGPPLFPNFMF